jgi:predicted dehydrogenase
MLRVAIIGAGQVGDRHAEAYAVAPGVSLAAVADLDGGRAKSLAAKYSARPYSDHTAMLREGELDAVSICLPHSLHRQVALECADAGVHILMEKPISNTLEEARDIMDACRRHDVNLMLGFVHRFRSEALAADRIVRSGALGPIATAQDAFCSLGGSHPPSWVWSKEHAGGGVLMYGGIHAVDRLLWLVDSDVTEVMAHTTNYSRMGDVEDGLTALLRFSNGVIATLFENSPPYRALAGWSTDLYGPEGCLRIKTGEYVEFASNDQSYVQQTRDNYNFHREIAEFVTSIEEKREPWITGMDGWRALAVALAIYQSASDGAPVGVSTYVH